MKSTTSPLLPLACLVGGLALSGCNNPPSTDTTTEKTTIIRDKSAPPSINVTSPPTSTHTETHTNTSTTNPPDSGTGTSGDSNPPTSTNGTNTTTTTGG